MIFIGGVVLMIIQICSTKVLAEFNSSEQLQYNNNEVDQKIDSLAQDINTFTAHLNFTDKTCGSHLKGCLKPPSQNGRLKVLEDEIKNMKKMIEHLKNSSNIDNDTKQRLSNLEQEVARLQKIIDDANKEVWGAVEQFEKMIEELTSQVEYYQKKLDDLEKLFNKKEEEKRQRKLRAQIIDDIKSRNYLSALERLEQLDGELKMNINYIVHEVYNNQQGNFDLILQFGDASKNATISLAVYRALVFEMESNGYNDYQRILKLMSSLKRNIIDKKAPEAPEAKKLFETLHSSVGGIVAPLLKKGFLTKNREKVSEISDGIYTYFSEMIRVVYGQAVKEMTTTELQKSIFFFVAHKHRVQRIYGYSAIFSELKKKCSLEPTEVLKNLIYNLEAALTYTDQITLADAKYYLQNGIPDLPVSTNPPGNPEELTCKIFL